MRRMSLQDVHERNYLGGGCCFLIGAVLYVMGFTVPFWPHTMGEVRPALAEVDDSHYSTATENFTTTVGNVTGVWSMESGLSRYHINDTLHNRWMLINFVMRSVTTALLMVTAVFTICLFVGLNETSCPRFMRYSGIFCSLLAFVGEMMLWASGQLDSTVTGSDVESMATAFCTVGSLLCFAGGFMFCRVYPLNARLTLGIIDGGCCFGYSQVHDAERVPGANDEGAARAGQGRAPNGEAQPLLGRR